MTLCGDLEVQGATLQRLALRVVAVERHVDAEGGNGEGVADPVAGVGVDDLERLAVEDGDVRRSSRCTWPSCWLRSGLPESYWSIVTLIRVWAGHLPDRGVDPLPVGRLDQVRDPGRVGCRTRSSRPSAPSG